MPLRPKRKKRAGGASHGVLSKLKKPKKLPVTHKLDEIRKKTVADISGDLHEKDNDDDETPSSSKDRSSPRFKAPTERSESDSDDEEPATRLSSRRYARTKVTFSKKKTKRLSKKGTASTTPPNRENLNVEYDREAQQSLEICQGVSKIKLEDWYPFFDFEFRKKYKERPEVITADRNEEVELADEEKEEEEEVGDVDGSEDEWEETLVYVDLEGIPHAAGLFSALHPATNKEENGEEEEEAQDDEEDTGDGDGANADGGGGAVGGSLSHIEMQVFNMDTQLPIILIGGKYLTCQWQDTLGTSLFFKKKSESPEKTDEGKGNGEGDNGVQTKLKNIVPEPEIPFDPIFGSASVGSGEQNSHELVAKSFKILKAKHFSIVNEEHKWDEFIKDNDDEFDPRDFQIPPVHMVRKYSKEKEVNYEKYLEKDLDRRRRIQEKWGKGKEDRGGVGGVGRENVEAEPEVKPEPLENLYGSSPEEFDPFLEEIEPIPGPSHRKS